MITIIVTTLFISIVINVILKKLHLPTIIGYIITGTIIAYGFGLHSAVNNHELKEIAEFGVVFLMFTIGLEFSVEHLKRMRYEVFIAGSMQIIITSLITFLMAFYIFQIPQKISFIISLAIALSSTAIVLKTFNETGEINRRYGQRSLGILIMQDIAVIPILLIIGFMSSNSSDSISFVLLEMAISATALIIILWFSAKYLLEPFFNQITQANSDELFIGTILFLAIGASYLAHVLGFSYSLGAFISGMLISETKYKHQAEADLIPFRDILLGIFFITVGMQIDFLIIFEYIDIIIGVLILAMAVKFGIIYSIVKLTENKKVSIKTALSLIQIGEFSLAILELARANSLIGPPYGQIMILVIVISMIITPLILKNLSSITALIHKQKEEVLSDVNQIDPNEFKNHTIIIGFGEFGQDVAKYLKENSFSYLAIENNINIYQKIKNENHPIIYGNAIKKKILKSANLKEARNVVVAIDNPKKLYHVCHTLTEYLPNEEIIVKVHNKEDAKDLEELGLKNIFVENDILSKAVAQKIVSH
jgi:CPA2 family monovalent cation:H+ antiporter-2